MQDASVLSYVNKVELINAVVNGLVDSAVTLAYQTDLSVKQKQTAIVSLFKTVHRCFQNESCTIVLQQLICNKFLTLSLSIFDNKSQLCGSDQLKSNFILVLRDVCRTSFDNLISQLFSLFQQKLQQPEQASTILLVDVFALLIENMVLDAKTLNLLLGELWIILLYTTNQQYTIGSDCESVGFIGKVVKPQQLVQNPSELNKLSEAKQSFQLVQEDPINTTTLNYEVFLKIGQMRAIIGMDKAQQFSMILRLVGAACRAWATFNPEQVEQIALQNQKIRNMTCMVQLQQIHTSYIELSLFEVLYIGI